MTLRDFAKIAVFTEEYSHLSVFDPSGMHQCGYFNSVYKLSEDDALLDYEIIRIKGNFYVTIDISEDEAIKQEKAHSIWGKK